MKRQILAVLMLAAFGASCGSNGYSSTTSPTNTTPIPAGPSTVLIPSTAAGFAPGTLTVSTGTTVTWGNNDGTVHNSTADGGQWTSPTLSGGQTFTHKFDSTGSFKYHCTIHPEMTGTIVVQ